MCGIVGFFGKGREEDIKRMASSIKHRGPDDDGVFFRDGLGLGHVRLSILDITNAGHQPMFDERRQVAIVFNGEIYNFKKLNEKLKNRGYNFRTNSDTETIINMYLEFGESCFNQIDGMFALAIYDFKKNIIILARDRMGKKPLYWGVVSGSLVFGSEQKAIISYPFFKKKLNIKSVNKFFALDYIPTPDTIFEDLFKLEPGSYLAFDGKMIIKEKFWRPDFSERDTTLKSALVSLDKILNESVQSRLVSDVPLGVLLSGGIDSSTIAYYASKNSSDRIKTFSIGFKEQSFDESVYARRVSDFLGTEHYEQILSAKDSLELIPNIADISDEPLADASIIPTYLLSKFTKEKVTVALGGDGGDELFAGYPTFHADTLLKVTSLIKPVLSSSIVEKFLDNIPVSDKDLSLGFKVKKFIDGIWGDGKYLHQRWLGSFSKTDRSYLFGSDVWQIVNGTNEFENFDKWFNEASESNPENQVLYLYMRGYLMDQVLVKVDRASMANALEVRAPFLDTALVEYVISLPYKYKYSWFTTKYILKKLMSNKLPLDIVHRRKKGFGIPLAKWLREDLKVFCDDLLSKKTSDEIGLFNYDFIEKLKFDHFSGRRDNRKLLWPLVIFFLWHNKWMK